ncbi:MULTISPECIES: SPFH domain-containing protein [unclassified Microcoleus]|uniref:SPFH domain-containing protein n=1 Tax=unclassified Microcoleus TaxID=2642155 RepID=UPI002FD606B5
MYQYFLMVLFAITGVSLASSVKIVRQGDEALVEIFGKYDRKKLEPGITFLIPFVEQVAYKETLREQILRLPSQQCTTRDRISITVYFIVYWRIINLEKACYKVQNLKEAMLNMLIVSIRTHIAKLSVEELYAARHEINNALVKELDTTTDPWGVKFTRVELRDFAIGTKATKPAYPDQKEA